MSYGLSLWRTVGFAVAYGIAVLIGRRFALDEAGVTLVWPAAGVGAVWLCAQRHAPARWLDLVALPLVLVSVTLLTGAPPVAAVGYGFGGLAQALVFRWLLVRLRPALWGAAGSAPMRSPRDLWGLLVAAFAACVCGCAVASVGEWISEGGYPVGRHRDERGP